jgi:chitinase
MSFLNQLQSLKARAFRAPVRQWRRSPSRRQSLAGRLAVETLEDRCVPASLSISDVSILEGNAGTRNAVVTVSLAGTSNPPVTVAYSTANGTALAGSDYRAVSGSLTFEKGATSKSILVPVNGDTLTERDETFFVNLNTAKHATIADGQGVVTIGNDDTRIRVNDVTLTEGDSGTMNFIFTVSLEVAVSQPVTVSYATADGTATDGSDYEAASGTLTIPAGQTSRTVTVAVKGDRLSEPDEIFFVNLSNPTNAVIADGQGVGTITDNEPHVVISDPTLLEGDSGTVTMTFDVSLRTPYDLPVTIQYATGDGTATAGSDYTADSGTLTFQPGETLHSIAIPVHGDRVIEDDETIPVNLTTLDSYVAIDQSVGIGTIQDNEPHIVISDTSQDYYGLTMTFVVSLAVPYDQVVTVDFATMDGTAAADLDYVATSGTLTFNPGDTTQTITVTLLSLDPSPDKYFCVQLSNPSANASLVNNLGLGFWYYDYGW